MSSADGAALSSRVAGGSGRVALSFAAMEQYFQREGRDWERYAWQKARPVAGDEVLLLAQVISFGPLGGRTYGDESFAVSATGGDLAGPCAMGRSRAGT